MPTIKRLQSLLLNIGTDTDEAACGPILQDIALSQLGTWASISCFTAIFQVSSGLTSSRRIDYLGNGAACNLVEVADGELYCIFSATEPLAESSIRSLGRFFQNGALVMVPYPDDTKVLAIARLGQSSLVVQSERNGKLYICNGTSYRRIDLPSGVGDIASSPAFLSSAADGKVWYLRSIREQTLLGRVDINGNVRETTIRLGRLAITYRGILIYRGDTVYLFYQFARGDDEIQAVTKYDASGTVLREVFTEEVPFFFGAGAINKSRIWVVDGNKTLFALSLRCKTLASRDIALLTQPDGIVAYRDGVLLAQGNKLEYYSLS